jgi:hypothetical protein
MVKPSGLIIDNVTSGGHVVVAPGKVASVTMRASTKEASRKIDSVRGLIDYY